MASMPEEFPKPDSRILITYIICSIRRLYKRNRVIHRAKQWLHRVIQKIL